MKMAILYSQHIEEARIPIEDLDWAYATPIKGEDLIKVVNTKGKIFWCDEIEFVTITTGSNEYD